MEVSGVSPRSVSVGRGKTKGTDMSKVDNSFEEFSYKRKQENGVVEKEEMEVRMELLLYITEINIYMEALYFIYKFDFD